MFRLVPGQSYDVTDGDGNPIRVAGKGQPVYSQWEFESRYLNGPAAKKIIQSPTSK